MKTKWIGLAILAVVIAAAAGYAVFSANAQVLELNGYLGGEKIGLFEDAEVQEIFRSRYRLSLDYARAGSLEMITADQTGMNYLFPSNQTALELYEQDRRRFVGKHGCSSCLVDDITYILHSCADRREGVEVP